MEAICLIADIVRSRAIENRSEFQKKLKGQLDAINELSAAHLLSPFTITLGDEFQAVYEDFANVFPDIARILCAIFPAKIRFAISRNAITTEINREEALGMDGPAFHIARDTLNDLKKSANTAIAIDDAGNGHVEIINDSLRMLSRELSRWNYTSLWCFMNLLRGKSVAEFEGGEKSAVKKRTIYKSIEVNDIRLYVDYLTALTRLLEGRTK